MSKEVVEKLFNLLSSYGDTNGTPLGEAIEILDSLLLEPEDKAERVLSNAEKMLKEKQKIYENTDFGHSPDGLTYLIEIKLLKQLLEVEDGN